MFAKIIVLAIACCILGLSNAQVFQSGPCPCQVRVMNNFNVSAYLGTWFEYAKYTTMFEGSGKCVTALYSERFDGNVGVNNSQISAQSGEQISIQGYAVLVEDGKLNVVFPNSVSLSSSNYWVLDTDYSTYSVVYNCQSFYNVQHATFAWILTRQRHPSAATINTARSVLVRNGVSLNELVITDQSGC